MTSQQLLDSGFSGEILTPEATGFAEASARYTSIAESVAKFIVFPKSAKDVSLALAFVQKYVGPVADFCNLLRAI